MEDRFEDTLGSTYLLQVMYFAVFGKHRLQVWGVGITVSGVLNFPRCPLGSSFRRPYPRPPPATGASTQQTHPLERPRSSQGPLAWTPLGPYGSYL